MPAQERRQKKGPTGVVPDVVAAAAAAAAVAVAVANADGVVNGLVDAGEWDAGLGGCYGGKVDRS
jgi:hypothetical protein